MRSRPVVGSIVFFGVAPGLVAGWVPYALSGWRLEEPFFGVSAGRIPGAILVLLGVACLVDSFARFAIEGEGTPAPVAPTERLIVSGFYRHVRNPMYVAVVAIILGQSVLTGSVLLLGYASAVWLACHLFVLVYEEPTLHKQFGASYRLYQSQVRRWWPRLRPWRGGDTPQSSYAATCMSQDNLTVRPAAPTEADVLSALALRSKAHWGYSAEFLEACRAELTYSPEQLKAPESTIVVAELSGAVIGFYALERSSATEFELDALFVEPGKIGQGIGRLLLENAKETAAKLGGKTLVVQADPHAEEFYRAAGGETSGQRESGSIPGRYLTVFTIRLRLTDAA